MVMKFPKVNLLSISWQTFASLVTALYSISTESTLCVVAET